MDVSNNGGQRNEEDVQYYTVSSRWFVFSLPVISSMLSFVACLMAYIIGVNNGTLKSLPFVPFISDTGNFKPSSSIFTLFLILSSFASLSIVLIRFYQVAASKHNSLVTANKIALSFGVIFVLGKVIVSSFQLSSSMLIHYLAAGIYFLGATIYALLQTYISGKILGKVTKTRFIEDGRWRRECITYVFRIICCCGLICNLLLFGIFATVPSLSIHNRDGANVAQGAEWALAVFKIFFLLTFLNDFWNIEYTFEVKFRDMTSSSERDLDQPDHVMFNTRNDRVNLAYQFS